MIPTRRSVLERNLATEPKSELRYFFEVMRPRLMLHGNSECSSGAPMRLAEIFVA